MKEVKMLFGQQPITRRRILQRSAIGLGGITTLAGCVDDNPETAGITGNITETPTATPGENTPSEAEADDVTPTETEESPTETEEETEQEDGRWYIRPEKSSDTVPSQLLCDEDHEGRFPQRFKGDDLEWGDDTEDLWELRVDTLNAEFRDTVTVRLRNVSGETESRSSRNDFNIQVETEVGWQEVRVKENESDAGTHDALRSEEPGEGVEWELQMTEPDLPEAGAGRGKVCPGLPSGRYRFVFEGTETQPIGVAFDFKN